MSRMVGIRKEDKSIWERRVPLVPADVAELASPELRFVVQPSERRVYGDLEYQQAGATVGEDLSQAQVVFAVKEVPIDLLLPDRTYVFFAHVIKGQSYNMPLLQHILEQRITLIDYERIVDDNERRLVLFGREAGQAGMIETLHALGRRLASEGQNNPFLSIDQPYRYASLEQAKRALRQLGRELAAGQVPGDGPLVVGFAGRGSVSQGAQELYDLLQPEEIEAEDLPHLEQRYSKGELRSKIFKVVFRKRHTVRPLAAGETYRRDDYHQHPERYRGCLVDHLPHLTVLVNAIYWQANQPRLLTKEDMASLWARGERRLKVIGDLSIDIEGGIELAVKATQPDCPTYVYQPESGTIVDGVEGDGVVVLAVDNLPCELPREASEQFSRALRPFVPAIASCDYKRPFAELALPAEIQRAVITHRGQLTPDYQHLERFLQRSA